MFKSSGVQMYFFPHLTSIPFPQHLLPLFTIFVSCRYLAHGTGTDYMFEKLGVPMSFTWEIYGDEKASFEDCFKMFNPLSKDDFERVVILWVKALLQMIELLPTHPSTWPLFRHAGISRVGDDSKEEPKEDDTAAAAAEQQQQQHGEDAGSQISSNSAVGRAGDKAGDKAAAADSGRQVAPQQQQAQDQQVQSVDADDQQQQKQQQQAANISSTAAAAAETEASQEEQIHILHRIPPAVDQPLSESVFDLGALHSKRVIPLLLGLVGMGVLLYYATR